MAVTVTLARAGTFIRQWTVEATADVDSGASFGHGFGFNPLADPTDYLIWQCNPTTDPGGLAAWGWLNSYTGGGNSNVSFRKLLAVGSGAAGAQVLITGWRPHSIIR